MSVYFKTSETEITIDLGKISGGFQACKQATGSLVLTHAGLSLPKSLFCDKD